jgi:hypothetical protein
MALNVNKLLLNIDFAMRCIGGCFRDFISAKDGMDPEKWEELRKGLEYNEEPLQEMTRETGSSPLGMGLLLQMVKIFGIILIAGLLIFLIIKLITNYTGKGNPSKKKSTEIALDEEQIPDADQPYEVLWKYFKEAKNAGNYRECVRLLYQISLKRLADEGLVKTQADKTNREYLGELKPGATASDFKGLTLIHERSWYAARKVGPGDFEKWEPRFMHFINNRKDGEVS